MHLLALLIAFSTACAPEAPGDPSTDPVSCDDGFIADGSACVPQSCGVGRWGDLPVDEDTVYVDGSAPEGGDGTEAAPYSMIQRGLNRAGALGGGLVAVAGGVYPETLEFTDENDDVLLAGRCREMVILDASVGDDETPGIRSNADISLEGLTVRDSLGGGLRVESGEAIVRDVAILDNAQYGVKVREESKFGSTRLTMEGCLIDGNEYLGLGAAYTGTEATIRDTTIRNSYSNGHPSGGHDLEVFGGAIVRMEDCLLEGEAEVAVVALNAGTAVTLVDCLVRNIHADASQAAFGYGFQITDEAAVTVENTIIEEALQTGMLISDAGTEVTLLDSVVKGTHAVGDFGRGIMIQYEASLVAERTRIEGNDELGICISGGATVTLRDSLVEGNAQAGIFVTDPETRVILGNSVVSGTRLDPTGKWGRGIQATKGSTVFLDGCLIDQNTGGGIALGDEGTRSTMRNTTVRNTQPDVTGEAEGVAILNAATLSMDSCLIEDNAGTGFFAGSPGTRVTIRNSTISGTRMGFHPNFSAAPGLNVQEAVVTSSRLVIRDNEGPGILVNSPGSIMECVECTIEGNQFAGAVVIRDGTLELTDTSVSGTRSQANLLGGAGIYAWPWVGGLTTVILTRTLIQDNPIAGVWLIGDGTFILTDNTIAGGIGETFGSGTRCGDAVLVRDGVTAWNGASGLLLQGNTFLDASGSGIFLQDSAALLSGNSWSGNAMDLVSQGQGCDAVPDSYAEALVRDICPTWGYPTCYDEFFFQALPAEPIDEAAAPRFPMAPPPDLLNVPIRMMLHTPTG